MPSPAIFATRPQRPREVVSNRDPSRDTLRASVLDVALELGIGSSRAVESLIFDSVQEEDESVTTPTLISASAATSDESWPLIPAWSHADVVLPVSKPTSVARTPTPDLQAGRARSEDSHIATPPLPHQPRKLRKARKDGYESDGGYLSDSSKKKKKDKKDQKNGSELSFGTEYRFDGEHLADLTKSGVDKKKKQKDKGSKALDDPGTNSSIKTSNISTKKSRMPSDDGGVSDGGYLSEATGKKKRSFFSRRSRSPSTTRKGLLSDAPPPVPTLPSTPIPTVEDFTRSPNFSNLPDGGSLNGGTPIWASHRTVPPSLDERPASNSSLQMTDRSSSPSSDNIKGTIRSRSVDTSTERLTPSTSSHEMGGNLPVPHALPWEAASYIPRPHNPETHPRSEAHPHDQPPAPASAASRPYGVRFTPSTRFDSSGGIFPTPPSSPAVVITSEGSAPRPKIIPDALKATPSSGPPSPVPPVWRHASPMSAPLAPQPFLSRSLRSTPSLGTLTPPVPRGVSPAFSDSSVITSSDFIVRSPRPRFFEDLPPPSPPPTGPLPEVPSHGPYSHIVPQIRRGRQSPFPTQGILPVQEVSRIIERTERRRREAQVGIQPESMDDDINSDLHDDLLQLTDRVVLVPPSPPHSDVQEDEYDWRDDEPVRPDIAQFYFYESPSSSGITTGRVAPGPSPDEPDDFSTYKFPFVQSLSSENLPPSRMTPAVPSGIRSYYFEHGRDGGGEDAEGRSQFFDDDDDENNHVMRTRFVARVADAFHGVEKPRPVPKLLRPF